MYLHVLNDRNEIPVGRAWWTKSERVCVITRDQIMVCPGTYYAIRKGIQKGEVTSADRSPLFRLSRDEKGIQKPTWQLLLDWMEILNFFLAGI